MHNTRHPTPRPALRHAALSLAAACWLTAAPAVAQEAFPSKTLHLVVPAVPGGSAGAAAQMLAEEFRKRWKQTVVVDYKGGAGSVIGTDYVAKSKPDGYTLLVNSSAHTVNTVVFAKLPYDTEADLVPMALVSTTPQALVVDPRLGIDNLDELVKAARAHPEKWSFGFATSVSQLVEYWFNMLAGTKIEVVPYKGAGPMMNDLMGGQIQGALVAVTSVQPFIKSGKMKLLGVASKTPSALFPDAPTLAHGAFDEFVTESWFGVFAVAGTPQPVLDRIATDLDAILKDPEVRKKLEEQGAQPGDEGPKVFAQRVAREIATWKKVALAAGVKPE